MDQQKRILRLGAAVLATATLFRLGAGGFFAPLVQALEHPGVGALVLYLETGRVMDGPPRQTQPPATVPPETQTQSTTPRLTFSPEDAKLVPIRNYAGIDPDLEDLLCRPLELDTAGTGPKVLILHSHATESYTPTAQDPYEASGDYRTLDTGHNLVAVGDHLAQLLNQAGIETIQCRELHDYPSYNDSYINSRACAQEILARYPGICLVLDLHRDAAETPTGAQVRTQATVDGRSSAQLMLVVGSDATRNHPDWQENLSLALKLQVLLETRYPGLCRDLSFRSQRFNQDLTPGALLIEVGTAGNTLEEALTAADALGAGIISLIQGS